MRNQKIVNLRAIAILVVVFVNFVCFGLVAYIMTHMFRKLRLNLFIGE